ncbi:glycoside hydrolase family 16 protein [Pseudobacteriovorax antillogorgiicola]|uniref:Glycosyl hydrolases family 16 n=1 Tax=Pseudobacteriovorax antillogorgiicola TaxID=1513793 RepID=A0A1Y6C439_9BACT|nr:glycoside hydrolase family 16 protein [Pseudobacteriovorax antillogorgiicola]TCS49883.1 glycosyl hydrolase family 16 [Pseudobacteriovorax antillogorgiicola]SMF44543.1 Glycosyl hydrolases family 16 [Pseudobacteriovorax antillogorgiicola]
MRLIFLLSLCLMGASSQKSYHGAEVYSKEKVRFGKFEMRVKSASASGTLSSFFLYDDVSWQGSHPWGEIDIEMLQRDERLVQTNLITGLRDSKRYAEQKHFSPTSLAKQFNIYAVEWTPNEISWYLNGSLLRREYGPQVEELSDQFLSYRFNHWVSSSIEWVGPVDRKALPIVQEIDWIRYYRYTPWKNGGKSRFEFSWQDDFNYFDESRWARADWTFEGNEAQFSPENVQVKDGVLRLTLSRRR